MTVAIAGESLERIASGEEPPPIASDIAYAMIDGATPLRAIRIHHGWDLADLARATGLPVNAVMSFDEGAQEPGPDDRRLLGKALGVDPRWLEPL